MIVNFIFIVLLLPTCKAQTSSQSDELNCRAMVCNFESGNLCNYENVESSEVSSPGVWKRFDTSRRAFRNLATGVRYPGEGSVFASTYLKSGERAMLESVGALKSDGIRYVFPMPSDRIIRFKVYKVADKMELKGCCDSIYNCPYTTEKDVKITDFNRWKIANFICKAGTQKILFYGVNYGMNEGAIGLDDVQMYLPAYASADKSESNACYKPNNGDGNIVPIIIPSSGGDVSGSVNGVQPANSGNSWRLPENVVQPTSNGGSNANGNSGSGSNNSGSGSFISNNGGGSGNSNTGTGNLGGNDNGNTGNGNLGGSGNGNTGTGNLGGSGNGNTGTGNLGGSGNGNTGTSNLGGSGNGNTGTSNLGGSGNGNTGTSNLGGSGNGNTGTGNFGGSGGSSNSFNRGGTNVQGSKNQPNGENSGNINTDNDSVGSHMISISFADNPNMSNSSSISSAKRSQTW